MSSVEINQIVLNKLMKMKNWKHENKIAKIVLKSVK